MEKSSTLVISSPNVKYTDEYIYSDYQYDETLVTKNGDDLVVSEFFEYFPFAVFDNFELDNVRSICWVCSRNLEQVSLVCYK